MIEVAMSNRTAPAYLLRHEIAELEVEFQIAANACPQRQHFEVEALRERIEALKVRAR
jgi:hypothetical protein